MQAKWLFWTNPVGGQTPLHRYLRLVVKEVHVKLRFRLGYKLHKSATAQKSICFSQKFPVYALSHVQATKLLLESTTVCTWLNKHWFVVDKFLQLHINIFFNVCKVVAFVVSVADILR